MSEQETTIIKQPLYRAIASRIDAYKRCIETHNTLWEEKHLEGIRHMESLLPSGAGIDNGTQIDVDASTGEKLVLITSFHHMNDVGYYDGWTEHIICVKPSLIHGITMTISGKDRNQIKDYLYEVYDVALSENVDPYAYEREQIAKENKDAATAN